MTHYLKTWKRYYERVLSNEKTFEVRFNDRDFQVGDKLVLQEFDQETEIYTGREIETKVFYILHGGNFGIQDGYVVMGIGDLYVVQD